MTIALDYDGTYTEAPVLFGRFCEDAERMGVEIVVVTYRHSNNPIKDLGLPVIYTHGNKKRPYCEARGIHIDVWIDDMPELING